MYKLFEVGIIIFLFSACKHAENKPDGTSYDKLTEQERRLTSNALSGFTVADGLGVELFASEPMLTNPTNIAIDQQGRVWVCEAYNYDVDSIQEDRNGDRIIVLEDTDNNGKADKKTLFYQGTDINTPLGIAVLDNKVYISRSPNLLILSDTNGDLKADIKDTLFTNMGNKGDHSAHAMFSGPDGRFYFSVGNSAGDIRDKFGNPIISKSGFEVTQKGMPYLGGMVLRFQPDGSDFDVLGHNFRNNYEPAIDSYGNIWQSDNDDDGNAAVRINFLLPYGNYGYLDEFTKASWNTNRIGLEKAISDRHWHQADPGVVPNVLITGAGSPAGMTVYEGQQLPSEFKGMPVHAEPYYNVVRSYITKKQGAGYKASAKDILKSKDKWFRPIDVATAPDGSLFIADWYDPILGGGAAGDKDRGRIYRVSTDISSYSTKSTSTQTIAQAIEALKNPNSAVQYAAFKKLRDASDEALPALLEIWRSQDPVFRARSLWLLAASDSSETVLDEALKDGNPDIRITAVRAILKDKANPLLYFKRLANDPDAGVRRELATSLRYLHTTEAAALWVELAEQYDGRDRWYLEALGIGSDLHADLYFNTWLLKKHDLDDKATQDIIWRIRSEKAMPLLVKLIKSSPDLENTFRFFRAFDFHRGKSKNDVLTTLLSVPGNNGKALAVLALQQMDGKSVKITASLQRALDDALDQTKGKMAFLNLVEKFNVSNQRQQLLELCVQEQDDEMAKASLGLLVKMKNFELLDSALHSKNSLIPALLKSMNGNGNNELIKLVRGIVSDSLRPLEIRRAAINTLASTWRGESALLELVKIPGFDLKLKPLAAAVLFNVYRSSIQREAAQYLPRPSAKESQLPSLKVLQATSGNPENGFQIFSTQCITCHSVKNIGVKFGPALNSVGSKLSREGLFRAIMYPDEGISIGYETSLVTTDDNKQMGIITNETDNEIELNQPGGAKIKIQKGQVKLREKVEKSMMPMLASGMSVQELVDLVAYLETFKN